MTVERRRDNQQWLLDYLVKTTGRVQNLDNVFLKRGVHVLALDGPGQGMSNLRKIRVDADNYADAGRAAIDFLVARPEVDAEQIALLGLSMGSYWAPLIASRDRRGKGRAR